MDYRRIILTSDPDDAYGTFIRCDDSNPGSLPRAIRFFTGTLNSDQATVRASALNKRSRITWHSANGIIGDDALEFGIDFDENIKFEADSADRMTAPRVISLYNLINDDAYSVVSRNWLFANFWVYEVDDASCQAMSPLNYDFYPKVFVENGETTCKIINKQVCVLKSFTMKKAWVMIDKTCIGMQSNTIPSSIILDYGIILTDAEASDGTTLRFESIGRYDNLIGMLANPATYTPLFDYATDSQATTKKYVINQQHGYFGGRNAAGNEQHKFSIRSLNGTANESASSLFTAYEGKNHDYPKYSDILKTRYTDAYAVDKTTGLCSRIIGTMENANAQTSGSYEKFSFLPIYARYVFGYADDITARQIRQKLTDEHLLMMNYDLSDGEIFKFKIDGANYAEALIPLYEDGTKHDATGVSGVSTENIDLVEFADDPSQMGISIGSAYAGAADDHILPYVYSQNEYAKDYFGNGAARIVSDELTRAELREYNHYDEIFDVVQADSLANSQAAHIDADAIIVELTNAGYGKDIQTSIPLFCKDAANIDSFDSAVAELFGDGLKQCESNEELAGYSFAIYEGTAEIECTMAYEDNGGGESTLVEKLQPEQGKRLIIPTSVDGLKSIKINAEVTAVY